MVNLEALFYRGLLVVVALHQFLSGGVVLAGGFGRIEQQMIGSSRSGMHAPSRQALDDLGIVHVDLDHVVEHYAGALHRVRLGNRAGEPVEQKASRCIRLPDALFYQTDDDVVGYQRAGIHEFFCLQAKWRACLDGGTQHVAGGNLRNAELSGDEGGLRAFAGARRAQKNKSHCSAVLLMEFRPGGTCGPVGSRPACCADYTGDRVPDKNERRIFSRSSGVSTPGSGAWSVTVTLIRWPCQSARNCSRHSNCSIAAGCRVA